MIPYERNKTLVNQEKYDIIVNGGKILKPLLPRLTKKQRIIIALKESGLLKELLA